MRASVVRVALGLDWGNSSPGCVLWGAALPNEHATIFDEMKFQRKTAKAVADDVKAKCREWDLRSVPPAACDPSLLPSKKGEAGEWIGLTLMRHGFPVRRVSNDRKNGWQRVHEAFSLCPHVECRSKEYPNGRPWLTIHPRCRYLIRTIPLMVQKKDDPEDLDSDSDDHACDALRYLLMGGLRPATPRREGSHLVPMSGKWWRKMYGDDRPAGVLG